MSAKVLKTIKVAVTIKKTYSVSIYEPEPADHPWTPEREKQYALEVARERAKDEEEWGSQVRYGLIEIVDEK